jgi:hypothetical protein
MNDGMFLFGQRPGGRLAAPDRDLSTMPTISRRAISGEHLPSHTTFLVTKCSCGLEHYSPIRSFSPANQIITEVSPALSLIPMEVLDGPLPGTAFVISCADIGDSSET